MTRFNATHILTLTYALISIFVSPARADMSCTADSGQRHFNFWARQLDPMDEHVGTSNSLGKIIYKAAYSFRGPDFKDAAERYPEMLEEYSETGSSIQITLYDGDDEIGGDQPYLHAASMKLKLLSQSPEGLAYMGTGSFTVFTKGSPDEIIMLPVICQTSYPVYLGPKKHVKVVAYYTPKEPSPVPSP